MNLLDEIKNDINAIELLKDWLGDKILHVEQSQADHRSLACIRGEDTFGCPHNRPAKNWEKYTKVAVAEVVRGQLELKHRMKMATPFDDHLGICDICGCWLSLAVWTPIDRIREHTTPKQHAKFPEHCWKKKELS